MRTAASHLSAAATLLRTAASQTLWDSNCGLLDAELMRLAASARSREQVRSPEYQELAAMFAQEVDAEKTGMHVDKRRSSELVQKALGLNGKPSDLVPSSRLREGCMRVSTG